MNRKVSPRAAGCAGVPQGHVLASIRNRPDADPVRTVADARSGQPPAGPVEAHPTRPGRHRGRCEQDLAGNRVEQVDLGGPAKVNEAIAAWVVIDVRSALSVIE